MTDSPSGERVLASACGNVTVTIAPGSSPKIELAKGATGLFPRDLAELVTATAREAADAARTEDPQPETPSLGDALQALTGFRDDLRDHGHAAAVDRRRAALGDDEDDNAAAPPERPASAKLALPPMALEALDAAIELWQRTQASPPGTGRGEAAEQPTGRARSDSRLVTVESTMEYPVASVTLSRHACESGPKVLAAELTETAAAAAADLAEKQHGYLAGLGLPVGPADAAALVGQGERVGADALDVVDTARQQQERITRMFQDGGHFA